MTWLETFSGRRFSLLRPNPDDVWLPDVAHALARLNRFVGHTGKGYSVAEHSLWVWKLIALEYPEDYLFQLHGQLHDAHEYVTGDISAPMKELLEMFGGGEALRRIERSVQTAICDSFRVPTPSPEAKRTIKIADARMLATEHLCPALMPHGGTHRWAVDDALEPHAGLRNGTTLLEPRTMLLPDTWDGDFPDSVSFPSWTGVYHPSDSHPVYRPLSKPLTESDVAFLFQCNGERLLSLIRSGQKPPG
jgi:hypothetical protein